MRLTLYNFLLVLAINTLGYSCSQNRAQDEAQTTSKTTTAQPSTEPAQTTDAPQQLVIQEQTEPDTLKGSPMAEARGKIGSANITIGYHSPAVRGRIVWGGLVPHDQVWVTGAHMATSLSTDAPVTIGGKNIPSGKYALFTIPGQDEWTVIINKNWKQHLADNYDAKEDLVRVKVKPQITAQNQERLRYEITPLPKNKAGEISISWEKRRVSFPVTQ